VTFFQSIKFCYQYGLRPVMFSTQEEMRCFVKYLIHYGLLIAPYKSSQWKDFKLSKNLEIEGTAIHLPISDENCLGKHAWCGTGHAVKPEVFNELRPRRNFQTSDEHRYCIHTWFNSVEHPTGNFYRDSCDISSNGLLQRHFVCDIPA
jgi:hypothetical protein